MVSLADVVDLRLSSVDKKITPGEKKVRLCNYSDVYNNSVLRSDMIFMEGTATEREVRNCKLEVGDVVITKDSETPDDIGVPAVVREKVADLICGYHLAILRPLKSELDGEYLHYALHTSKAKRQFQRYANGITRFGLRAGDIARVEIPLPPRPEQGKTAAILSSVDDAIEKTQAVIDQVQVVKRGLMQELLTRGLPGRHTRFKQTEIGEIPADWDARSIDALVISCDYGTSDALRNDGIGVPVLRMGNLQDGRVSLEDVKYIAADKVPDELMLSEGDVLFNRTNSADLVGKVAVFEQQRKVSFASYLLRLRVEPKQGNGYWLSYLLNTPELQKKLRSTATPGVSQVNISRRNLLATVVPVPSVEEQATIVSVLDSIQHRVDAEQGRADQLAVIKSALMSVLLTGELRVTPDHEPV